ncbi:MAG: hypothetical protein ACRDYZ_05645 [Acidimicrobiales bacterium]
MLRYLLTGQHLGDRSTGATMNDMQTVRRVRPPHRPAVHARHPLLSASALLVTLACAGALAAGIWLRLWLVLHVALDSDEAVVGLMAEQVLHGHFSAFYWGQSYGGVEPLLAAAGLAVLGHSGYALNATAATLDLVACALVAVLARVAGAGRAAAAVAASLAWLWPFSAVWNSTRELGFRQATLVLGLLLLVLAVSIVRRGGGPVRWSLLGLVGGVGWWASPEIAYFAVPAAGLLAWELVRRQARATVVRVAAAVAAFGVGALPWLVDNVQRGFASLSAAGVGGTTHGTYLHRLHVAFVDMAPMQLGLRAPTSGRWVTATTPAVALCVAAAVVVVAGMVGLWWRGPRPGRVLVAAVVAFPFLYAAFPPTDYWIDGRYALYFGPLLALVAVMGGALLLQALPRPGPGAGRRWLRTSAAVAVLAAGALSTAAGLGTTYPHADRSPGTTPVANAVTRQLVGALAAHHLTTVVAGYWVAYDVDFLSHQTITATPVGPIRVPADERAVAPSRHAAWLFVQPTAAGRRAVLAQFGSALPVPFAMPLQQFTGLLEAWHIDFRTVPVGPMVAVVPRAPAGALMARIAHAL